MEIFMMSIAQEYPIIFKIILYLGMARLIMKPIMVALQDIVKVIPGEKDNIFLAKILGHKLYTGLVYILDFAVSIKLPKLKSK